MSHNLLAIVSLSFNFLLHCVRDDECVEAAEPASLRGEAEASSFTKKVLPDNPDSPEYAKDREGLQTQIRSSAWLEHYTDNVGVSSSNLLGSTTS